MKTLSEYGLDWSYDHSKINICFSCYGFSGNEITASEPQQYTNGEIVIHCKCECGFMWNEVYRVHQIIPINRREDSMNYDKLRPHIGHRIVCVCYGEEGQDPVNISIECEECNEVLVSFDNESEEEV